MTKGKQVKAVGNKSPAPNKAPYGGTNKNVSGKKC